MLSLSCLIRGNATASLMELDEAQQIAERGPMPLYLADVRLHRARLVGGLNTQERNEKYPNIDPQAELAKARALIHKHHDGHRFPELADAEMAWGIQAAGSDS